MFITFAILGQSFDFLQLAIALDLHLRLHLVQVDSLLHRIRIGRPYFNSPIVLYDQRVADGLAHLHRWYPVKQTFGIGDARFAIILTQLCRPDLRANEALQRIRRKYRVYKGLADKPRSHQLTFPAMIGSVTAPRARRMQGRCRFIV